VGKKDISLLFFSQIEVNQVGKKDISLLFFSQIEVKSSGKEGYFFVFLLTNRGKIKWERRIFLSFSSNK
jgi:hypothetical protein